MAQRRGPVEQPDTGTTPEVERILDAALSLFSDIGIKRGTIGEVAKRAGVDRVTVYRRVGNKDEIVQAVVAREATRVFEQIVAAAGRPKTFEDRVAVGFASMIGALREHSLLNRMLGLEPETVLPQLTTEAGQLLAAATLATMTVFEQAASDGLIDNSDDMLPSAELIVRVAHSFLVTPHALVDVESTASATEFARNHLAPLVRRAATTP